MNEEIEDLKRKIRILERSNAILKDELSTITSKYSKASTLLEMIKILSRDKFRVRARLYKENYELSEKIKNEHRIKELTKEKVANARHSKNRSKKEMVISEWNNYKEKQELLGKPASKNSFAQKAAEKYSISYNTIRKNWLQGL